MKITVIGTGYVGLVTGACLAEMGAEITCVDTDCEKIEKLKKGTNPIYEPGLDELLERGINSGRLAFTTILSDAVDSAEIIFSAVGTPSDKDGSADLSYVLEVARQIGATMNSYKLIVTKSTVPVGTAMKVKETVAGELANRGLKIPFDVASNPEFLKEGSAVNDFMRPDRVVVGVDSERARELLTQLYLPMQLNSFRVIFMDIVSAEMTKYASNAILATRISFMNDIANLCELVGADANMIRQGMGSDSRIGNKFLYPGIGYGGSCFPKDVKALIHTAHKYGYDMGVIRAVEQVNERQKHLLFTKLLNYFNGDIAGRKITMWGLSFKPETDDVREAPALVLAELITDAGANLCVYDPVASEHFAETFGGKSDQIEYASDKYESLTGSDAVLVVTEWKEFRMPDFAQMTAAMKTPVIFDGRNIYDRNRVESAGFDYYCIGG